MKQSMAMLQMYRYMLQPGDGTAYNFYIVHFHLPLTALCIEAKTGETIAPMSLHHLVAGVGDWDMAEDNFVMLGICMSASQGSYEVRKSSLRNPLPHFIDYLRGKMPGVDPYTLAAVVLAAGVLVDKPDALLEAAEAMLRAPELL